MLLQIGMMETRQGWELMHEHLDCSLVLNVRFKNVILIAFFIAQSCFVFLLYNTNTINCYTYFVLQMGKVLVTKVQIPRKVFKVRVYN
jgi:hypothetical protein